MKNLLIPLAAAALLAGCSDKGLVGAKSIEPSVYTTFYPTTCFAERIVGDAVPVVCPLPAGADPITWKPSREVLERYQSARLVVTNGADLEQWVGRVSLPQSRVVDTSRKLAARFITYEEPVTHSHGSGEEHTHEGIDGHTWLDPENAREQARAVLAAVELAWPEHRDAFRANQKELEAELDALDAALRELTQVLGERTVVCSHAAYNYLGRRYGWELVNLDLDPAKEVDDDALAAIRGELGDVRDTVLLWESTPVEQAAERLRAELGLKSVLFSPAENPGPEELAGGADYFSIMQANVRRLTTTLGG